MNARVFGFGQVGGRLVLAEQLGRRWITCDTSRVALTPAKRRLMTEPFDFYQPARPEEGVDSGFVYKAVPHVTPKSIANTPDIKEGMSRAEIDAAIARRAEPETLYDRPLIDESRTRVSGPFTVEAVPAPMALSLDEMDSLATGGAKCGGRPPRTRPVGGPVGTDPAPRRAA